MMRAGKLTLISESPASRGYFEDRTETSREVYCTVKSVSRAEAYAAMSVGHAPSCIFCLAHDFEYNNEESCIYEGTRYQILRTYVTETDGIELTAERSNYL